MHINFSKLESASRSTTYYYFIIVFQFPATEAEWLQQAKLFEDMWQFPNCVGSVDGKHVAIIPPPGAGSYYFSYKHFHSMVLLAIANANYELLYINFGTNGRVSDGGVIENTDFHRKLCDGSLNLPGTNPVNGLPHVFISDEAFALRKDFMKPYNSKDLDQQKRIFNYHLSRARRVVENVFGIMVSRFHVLQQRINLKPENIESVVLACCVLHNFLRRNAPAHYTPPILWILKIPAPTTYKEVFEWKVPMLLMFHQCSVGTHRKMPRM